MTTQPRYLDFAREGSGDRRTYRRANSLIGLIWLLSTLALVKLAVWGTVEIAKSSDPAGLLQAVERSGGAPWPWLGFLAALVGFVPLAILLPWIIRRMHGRSWRTSATPFAHLELGQVVRGFLTWAAIFAVVVVATWAVLGGHTEVGFDLGEFVPALVVLLLLLPVQAFGQQLFFAGYLMQSASLDTPASGVLATISGLAYGVPFLFSPWIVQWIVPEVQVPDIPIPERAILMLGYIILGACLALVSLRTGTIELAIGAGLAYSLLSALLLSPHAGSLAGGSLLDVGTGLWPTVVHVTFLVVGLVVFVRVAGRFVPDPAVRQLMDPGGHMLPGGAVIKQPEGSAMWRLSVRSLLAHRLRLVLTILSIALGVSFVVGTMVFADTTNRALSRFFDNAPADVVVRPVDRVTVVGRGGPPPAMVMPESLVPTVAGTPGVLDAAPSVEQEGVLILDDRGEPFGGATSAHIGASWQRGGGDSAATLEGELPVGMGQVAVDTTTAQRMGIAIGDVIHLSTPLRTDRNRDWRVTGIFDIGLVGGATVALFDLPTAQAVVTGAGSVNQILVTTQDGAEPARVAEAINRGLGADSEAAAITGREAADEAESEVIGRLGFLNTIMLVFALVAIVMSTFLIFNTFSVLIAQRTRELALVRAVGAGSRQLQSGVLVQAAAVAIVGTATGIVLGLVLSFGLRAVVSWFGIDIPTGGLVIEPGMLLVAVLVGVGVTMLAAWIPALRASRVPPVQAMQADRAQSHGAATARWAFGVILACLALITAVLALRDSTPETAVAWMGLSALIAIGTFLVFAPAAAAGVLAVLGAPLRSSAGRLATANARRNRRRTTATAAALTIAVALMSMMTVLARSTTATADIEIDRAIGADMSIGSPPLYRPFDHSITRGVAEVPGIGDMTFIRTTLGERNQVAVPVFGVEPEKIADAINLTVVAGALADIGGDSVAIDSTIAEKLRLGVGDTYRAEFRTGPAEFTIAAIYEPIIVYEGLLTDLATAESLGATRGQDTAAYVTLAPGADAEQVRGGVSAVIDRNPAVQLQDATVLKEDFRNQINQLLGFIFAMLALAVVIGVLGIVNTLLLSVHERTSEIGLLRAVGATRSQIRVMVVTEAALIGLFGAVTGVVLGTAYGVLMQRVMEPLGIKQLELPWGLLAVFLFAGVVTGVIAAVWPAAIASRLNILQAIASE